MTLEEKRFQTVWIGGQRVGIIFETMSFMDVPKHGHLYCEIMHTEHILHRDLNAQWNHYDKETDTYMPICHDHLVQTEQIEQAKQDYAFEVLNDIFTDIQEEERIAGIKVNIELLENIMDKIISLNQCPACNELGDIEIGERRIKFKKNTGKVQVDLNECPKCKSRKTYAEIDYIKDRIEQLRYEI